MELLTLYESILKSLNFEITSEGLLTYCVAGAEIPAVIDNKRLVLPTREVLRRADWDHLIPFHPMSEGVLSRGESPVFKKLKEVINHRLRASVADILFQMAELGFDTSRHKSIPPKSSDILSAMSGIDEKFLDTLKRLLSNKSAGANNHVISVYLKNRGTFRGKSVSSVAMVFFPLLEQIEEGSDTVAGIKLRVKDRTILIKMFEYLFPDAANKEAYSAPTTGLSAPNFDALMRAYHNVAVRINQVMEKCRKVFSNPDELVSDLDWFDAFQDLSIYEGVIPVLTGNEGERVVASAAEMIIEPVPNFKKADSPPWNEEPTQKPTAVNNPFATNISDVLRSSGGPFVATAPTTPILPTQSSLNPPTQNSGKATEDYNAWKARKNIGAPPAPMGYGYPSAGGYPPPPPVYAQAVAGPAWLQQGPPPPPPPGEYAGRVRGTPLQPAYGYQMGYPQQPMYPQQPQYPQQQTAYGYGPPQGGL